MSRQVPISVAIVSNAPAPYRIHLHERIAEEIPSIRLTSIFLADGSNQAWQFGDMDHIGAVSMGPGEVLGEKRGLGHALRKIARTIAELRRRKPRAVMVGGYADPGCLAALLWARVSGAKVLMTADSNAAGDRARGAKRLIKNAIVRGVVGLCDAILPCGLQGRRYYARYGARPDRIFEMPYMGDMRHVRDLPAQRVAEVRARYGLEIDRRRIVCSGRHVDCKGYDTAIEAFNAIAAQRPEWDLVMAGDGELRAALEAKVDPSLRDRVIWLGFVKEQEDLVALYRCSDILLHPARSEAWGVVIQEAVASGMAVIASDRTGAAADLVHHGENGFIVSPDDVPATANALLQATDPDRIADLKAGSGDVYERWEMAFDPVAGFANALHAVGVLPGRDEVETGSLFGLKPAAA